MKYLKLFESNPKSIVQRKMDLLDNIFLELYDEGFDYKVIKGSGNYMYIPIFTDQSLDITFYPNNVSMGTSQKTGLFKSFLPYNLIYVVVTKEVRRFSDSDEKKLDSFTKRLKEMGMSTRGGVGGHNFRIFSFDKWGSMTNSSLV
jgi:hypothetical protein